MALKCIRRWHTKVKIGFICEGTTEAILLQSKAFKNLLSTLNLYAVNVINADGCGNLLPHNIEGYIQSLERAGATKIIILTDLDTDACVTLTKERISARPQDIVIIARKQIEAWFLACTISMQKLLNDASFYFTAPEQELIPFKTIKNLLLNNSGRGLGLGQTGAKIKLVRKLLALNLDIQGAANHPACPSARYFIDKLKSLK